MMRDSLSGHFAKSSGGFGFGWQLQQLKVASALREALRSAGCTDNPVFRRLALTLTIAFSSCDGF